MLDQKQWTPSLCLVNSFTISHWLSYVSVINQAPGKVFCREEGIHKWVRNSCVWFLHWSANFIKISTSHHLPPNPAWRLPVLTPILTFTSLIPVHLDSCIPTPPPSPHLFHSPSKCSVPYTNPTTTFIAQNPFQWLVSFQKSLQTAMSSTKGPSVRASLCPNIIKLLQGWQKTAGFSLFCAFPLPCTPAPFSVNTY